MKAPRFIFALLALYVAAAVTAEALHFVADIKGEVPEHNRVRLELRYLPPLTSATAADGSRHFFLLGSDNLGRGVFLRILQGTRLALRVGLVCALIAVPFGTLLGLIAGYFGGWPDTICSWLAATVAAIPSLLLIMAISLVVGKGMTGIYIGIGATTWVGVFRTVRSETAKQRTRGYVLAAKALGFGNTRILLRHILPNVGHLVIVALSLRFPAAVGTEVFMSFLGLGAQEDPSWGRMIDNARARLWQGVWWEGAFVTLAVFGLVLAANRLGDWLRDRLDPTTA